MEPDADKVNVRFIGRRSPEKLDNEGLNKTLALLVGVQIPASQPFKYFRVFIIIPSSTLCDWNVTDPRKS